MATVVTSKKALLIGMNYKNTAYELEGCLNDVCAMRKFLIESKFKVPEHHIRELCEENCTKQNIINCFRWLTKGARRGDRLFLYFSGHGIDGRDEAIKCITGEIILDDEIWRHLVSAVPAGVQLLCIFDCCHSGAIGDLQYTFSYNPHDSEFHMGIEKTAVTRGNIMMFSSSYDPQTSGDGSFDGKNLKLPGGSKSFDWESKHGAFTYFLIQAMNEHNCTIDYPDLLKAVQQQLEKAGYNQKPLFTCSKPQLFTGRLSL